MTKPNSRQNQPSRRRVISILGAVAGLPLAGAFGGSAARAENCLFQWSGSALGAMAKMTLCHPDQAEAERIVAMSIQEIERLERIFSLHRADSELSRLNRDGVLAAPSHELRLVMLEAVRFGELSDGAFDVTVQPLWSAYADHFAARPATSDGPDADVISRAMDLVDYRGIDIEAGRIKFKTNGMQATLNGIAQGYITDRVADLLRANGIENVLLELGETRALDQHPAGRPWRVGLADPTDPTSITRTVELENRALATSGGYGLSFDQHEKYHHIFDPRTGASAASNRSVSVVADLATVADALSTALYVLPADQAGHLVRSLSNVTAYMTPAAGQTITIES